MARKNRRKRIVKDTAIEQLISQEVPKTVPPSPWGGGIKIPKRTG